MKKQDLMHVIVATYSSLRVGLGLIAIGFPVYLALVGRWWFGVPMQDSMSSYYHAMPDASLWTIPGWLAGMSNFFIQLLVSVLAQAESVTPLRSWFVGPLFVMGVFLVLYHGFSGLEDRLLTFSGLFSIGVALFPSGYNCVASCRFTVHGIFAVLSFVLAGLVAILCRDQTLGLTKNLRLRSIYRWSYLVTGAGMVLLPLAAWWGSAWSGYSADKVFYVEAAGLWAFAGYWLLKSLELDGVEVALLNDDPSISVRRVRKFKGLITLNVLERPGERPQGPGTEAAGGLAPSPQP